VRASQFATVLLTLISATVTFYMDSIGGAWKLLIVTGAGTGSVLLLRWFWWRINAWSEISAMIVAALVALGLSRVQFSGSDVVVFAKSTLITAGITTVAWIVATFITPAEPDATLLAFYRRVHPMVHGWKRIAREAPELPPVRDFRANAFDTILGCVLVYGCLFGIGKLIFGAWLTAAALLAAAAIAGCLIWWDLSRRGWETLSGSAPSNNSEPAIRSETVGS
jgi:hypothetical protein